MESDPLRKVIFVQGSLAVALRTPSAQYWFIQPSTQNCHSGASSQYVSWVFVVPWIQGYP